VFHATEDPQDVGPPQAIRASEVVDYCVWAIQWKWERRLTPLRPDQDKISSEFDVWSIGTDHYY
jgi:hypothetical protein